MHSPPQVIGCGDALPVFGGPATVNDILRDGQWEMVKAFLPGGRKGRHGGRSDGRRFSTRCCGWRSPEHAGVIFRSGSGRIRVPDMGAEAHSSSSCPRYCTLAPSARRGVSLPLTLVDGLEARSSPTGPTMLTASTMPSWTRPASRSFRPAAIASISKALIGSSYPQRWRIESFFAKLKQWRRIATRFDKLAAIFLGFVKLVSNMLWLKRFKSSLQPRSLDQFLLSLAPRMASVA